MLIVSCEQTYFQTQIIERYETELSSQFSCYQVKLDPEEPSLRSSLAQLVQEYPELQQSQVTAVVTVTGSAELLTIKLRENEDKSPLDKFFGYLQWTREGLRVFPFPIVLWVTPDILSRMSLAAPDFWSWRGGVFRFSAPAMEIKEIVNTNFQEDLPSLHFEHSNILPLDELEERISQIQIQDSQSADLATLYDRLGQAYHERISLGKSKHLQADVDLAIAAFQKAIALQKNLELKTDQGNSLQRLGDLYDDLGQYQLATLVYQQSLKIFREIQDKQGEANALNTLGNVYDSLGEYQKAIDLHQESLNINRKIADSKGITNSLNNLGNVYFFLGDYQQAITFYEQSLDIARKIDYKEQEAGSLGALGSAYNSLGRYQLAIAFHQQSLDLARKIKDKRQEAASLGNLGISYSFLGEYQSAITLHKQSLEIKRKIGHREGEANSLNDLGYIYYLLQDYQRAINFYQQSVKIKREIGNKKGEAGSYFNVGLVFKEIQQKTDALKAFYKARQLFQSIELNSWVQRCDNEINSLTSLSTV
ncbi:MAG: tetratricopeptide repeat protein [Snowella sp.]|nr:tetratricopeptide repeat protein [Snowella sp.]